MKIAAQNHRKADCSRFVPMIAGDSAEYLGL